MHRCLNAEPLDKEMHGPDYYYMRDGWQEALSKRQTNNHVCHLDKKNSRCTARRRLDNRQRSTKLAKQHATMLKYGHGWLFLLHLALTFLALQVYLVCFLAPQRKGNWESPNFSTLTLAPPTANIVFHIEIILSRNRSKDVKIWMGTCHATFKIKNTRIWRFPNCRVFYLWKN